MAQPGRFGKNAEEREENLRTGGYTIVTSLDPKIQRVAMDEVTAKERSAARTPSAWSPSSRAPAGSRPPRSTASTAWTSSNNGPNTDSAKRQAGVPSNYPNTVAPLLGGGDMPGYQAGSTFKIFTMTAALDLGLPLNTPIMLADDRCGPST